MRPKVAAFPLTALILVALVACQGPAGPAGAAGGKGDPGTPGLMGTPGTSGTSGTPAFQAKVDVTPVLLNDADVVDKKGRPIDPDAATPAEAEAVPLTLDLGRYFVGGSGDRTYEIIGSWGAGGTEVATNTAANDQITAVIKGSTLEYTLTIPEGGWANTSLSETGVNLIHTNGFMATVRGTDDGIGADATVAIMLNRKPIADDDTNGIVTTSERSGAAVLILGVQDRKRRNDQNLVDEPLIASLFHKECAKIQECVLDVFTDDGDFMVTVVSMTRDDVMDTSKVGWSADGDAVTLTGMASTWDKDRKNADGNADARHAPVTVKLKAIDMGGQPTEVSVLVAVNGPPTPSEGAASVGRSAKTKVGEKVSFSTVPMGLFIDPDDDLFTLGAESSNDQVATANHAYSEADDPAEGFVATGIGRGTATITLTATSVVGGLFQVASMEFTVTVE